MKKSKFLADLKILGDRHARPPGSQVPISEKPQKWDFHKACKSR